MHRELAAERELGFVSVPDRRTGKSPNHSKCLNGVRCALQFATPRTQNMSFEFLG
jgi:hypothetical protein